MKINRLVSRALIGATTAIAITSPERAEATTQALSFSTGQLIATRTDPTHGIKAFAVILSATLAYTEQPINVVDLESTLEDKTTPIMNLEGILAVNGTFIKCVDKVTGEQFVFTSSFGHTNPETMVVDDSFSLIPVTAIGDEIGDDGKATGDVDLTLDWGTQAESSTIPSFDLLDQNYFITGLYEVNPIEKRTTPEDGLMEVFSFCKVVEDKENSTFSKSTEGCDSALSTVEQLTKFGQSFVNLHNLSIFVQLQNRYTPNQTPQWEIRPGLGSNRDYGYSSASVYFTKTTVVGKRDAAPGIPASAGRPVNYLDNPPVLLLRKAMFDTLNNGTDSFSNEIRAGFKRLRDRAINPRVTMPTTATPPKASATAKLTQDLIDSMAKGSNSGMTLPAHDSDLDGEIKEAIEEGRGKKVADPTEKVKA